MNLPLNQILFEFFERCPTHRDVVTDADRLQLQQVNNTFFPNEQEPNRNCSGCRARMWNRCFKLYNDLPKWVPKK